MPWSLIILVILTAAIILLWGLAVRCALDLLDRWLSKLTPEEEEKE